MSVIEETLFADNDEDAASQLEMPFSGTNESWQDTRKSEGANPWNRLGLSTLASPALRHLLKASDNVSGHVQVETRIDDQDQTNYHRNYLKEVNVLDTFLSYKWMLQALLRKTEKTEGGCTIKVADVLLFEAGEPTDWIYTSRSGSMKSRTFKCDSMQSWERFLKVACQASGTPKDDPEALICTKFSWGIEGVLGEHLSAQQLREFARTDPMNRFQVAGVQIIVGPKCGSSKNPSRKSIVYKAEFRRRGLKGSVIKHTKEYDVQETNWDSHMSNVTGHTNQTSSPSNRTAKIPNFTSLKQSAEPLNQDNTDAESNSRESRDTQVGPAMPWLVSKETMPSRSLNRSMLNDLTIKALRYIERSRGLELESLRCHFVVDFNDKLWLVGASRVLPIVTMPLTCEEVPEPDNEPQTKDIRGDVEKLTDNFPECLEAVKVAPQLRKPKQVQILFNYVQGCHFLANFSPIFLYRVCQSMTYRFVEQGVEVYYAGEVCDEMYVILSGKVRALQEPCSTTYCRTVDLCQKDVFGEQAVTRPGSKMLSQVIAIEDTHLIIISRQDVESILDPGKPNDSRWKIKRSHLEKCRKIFAFANHDRTEADLKIATSCSFDVYFFQNLPNRVHSELCRVAHFRQFKRGQKLFDIELKQPQVSEKSALMFYILLTGEALWKYNHGDEDREIIISGGNHLLSVGSAVATSEKCCEVLVIKVAHWEKIAKDLVPVRNTEHSQESVAPAQGGIFLTQVDLKEANTEQSSRKPQGKGTVAVPFNPLQHLDLQTQRHLTCCVTGVKFPASEQQCLRWRQIRDTALHLRKRQVHLAGFHRDMWLCEPSCKLRLQDTLVVSPYAYSIYVAEKNLEDQEKLFAKIVVHSSAPRIIDRVLPPAGCTKATTSLTLCGMFVELASIESPKSLAMLGTKYELRFRLCEEPTQIRFEISPENLPEGSGALEVNQVRMSWFFCADEGMNLYLQERGSVEFILQECVSDKIVANISIDLAEIADRVALHQSFKAKMVPADHPLADRIGLQFVHLNLNVGCIRFREVDAGFFRLKRRHGLYFPSTTFITECLPLDGWDPCNEAYIQQLVEGFVDDGDGTVLTADGKLIPRGRLGHQLISEDNTLWVQKSSSSRPPTSLRETPAPIWKRTCTGVARTVRALRKAPRTGTRPSSAPPRSFHRPETDVVHFSGSRKFSSSDANSNLGSAITSAEVPIFHQREGEYLRHQKLRKRPASALERPSERIKPRRPESAPLVRSEDAQDYDGLATPLSPHSCLVNGRRHDSVNDTHGARMDDVGLDIVTRASESNRYKTRIVRPASAMSRIGGQEQDTNRYAASLLAAMTRPTSALNRPAAKSVQGQGNTIPTLRPAWQVSKMLSTGGRGGKGSKLNKVIVALETCHDAWRSNLMSIPALEQDLKSLQTRTHLVSVPESSSR